MPFALRLLILCFACLPPALLAQQLEQLSASLSRSPDQVELLPFADHLTVVMIQGDEAEIMVLDPDYQLRYERYVPSLGLTPEAQYLGVSEEADSWHLYFIDQGSLSAVRVPREGGPVPLRLQGGLSGSFSGSFTFNGSMHLLRLSDWTNEIRLVKFRDGRQVFAETFPINLPDFVARAGGNFTRMDASTTHLGSTYAPAKWYRFEDQLVFTIDDTNGTDLVQVDLLQSIVRSYHLPLQGESQSWRSNSLCLGEVLMQLAYQEQDLHLRLLDWRRNETILTRHLRAGSGWEPATAGSWELRFVQAAMADSSGYREPIQNLQAWWGTLLKHPTAAIAAAPAEDGSWELLLGGVTAYEQIGVTGMVLSSRFEESTLRFQLTPPDPGEHAAPMVTLSSLRLASDWHHVTWQGQPLRVGHNATQRRLYLLH